MAKHQKAQDVFNETTFVFSKKSPFNQAFPKIQSLNVKVVETGDLNYGSSKTHYYDENSAGEYINCNNPRCYDGGFSLGEILRELIKKNESVFEGAKFCQGNEGSPKGRKIYQKCLNRFEIKAEIVYKEEKNETKKKDDTSQQETKDNTKDNLNG